MLEAGGWVLGTGYLILDTDYWSLVTGHWILDDRCRAGCWTKLKNKGSPFDFDISLICQIKRSDPFSFLPCWLCNIGVKRIDEEWLGQKTARVHSGRIVIMLDR